MQITKNKVATFDFQVTDDGGLVLDSSEQHGPFAYVHGIGYLIPGLEEALEGREAGEAFSISIPPVKAYGERDDALVQTLAKEQFAGIRDLHVGMRLEAHYDDGPRAMTVTRIDDESVTIDGNHPLAGMTLNFDVTVVEVREATSEELAYGHPFFEGGCDCGCGGDCSDECCD